jgi:hypothetical protein
MVGVVGSGFAMKSMLATAQAARAGSATAATGATVERKPCRL